MLRFCEACGSSFLPFLKFGHLPFNHPCDQLSSRTPLAIVIPLDRVPLVSEPVEANHPLEFAIAARTFARDAVAQPLVLCSSEYNKGKTCSPRPSIAIAFPFLRIILFSVSLCLCGKSRSLFSVTYELLFPQFPYFQQHLSCPLLFSNPSQKKELQ
jgi:hypothetical protein